MGFSVSGSFAIIVLASFIAFGTIYSAGTNSFDRVGDATRASHENALAQANTDINVTNASYGGGVLTVNVTNQGTTALSVNDTDLLVDGVYQPPGQLDAVSVVGHPNSDLWLPEDTLRFRLTRSTAPQRVKVVTEHGVADEVVVG